MKSIIKGLIVKGLLQLGLSATQKAKAPRYILLTAIAGLLICLGILFALIGLHQYLTLYYGSILSNMIFAVGFLILSIIILLAIKILKKRHKQQSPLEQSMRKLDDFGEKTQQHLKEAQQNAMSVLQNHTGKIIVATALIGLILGRRSKK